MKMPKIRSVTVLGLNENGRRVSTAEFKYNKGSELEFKDEADCHEKAKKVLRQFLKLPETKAYKKTNRGQLDTVMVVKTNQRNGVYYF